MLRLIYNMRTSYKWRHLFKESISPKLTFYSTEYAVEGALEAGMSCLKSPITEET